ncbi:MAG: NCS2 family permease [Leptospiraceae bacterium]|nr:NCS2 family permease [Leptospiraceae bacterium]MCP5511109.1 NCS2 family permease [Leptospiraceae bacterium]
MKYFVPGDIDGLFGLLLDNIIQFLVLIGLCIGVCGFPPEFVIGTIIPGATFSLLFGNLFYAYQARKLARETGRDDVTALPYGINTVSLFAFIFFVILPVYLRTKDYHLAWKVGLLAAFLSGLIEFFGSFIAESIRKITPRAALLSALAGIAITFISMDFLIRTYQNPFVSFIPLGIILLQYFGKLRYPLNIPGGLLCVIAGSVIAWASDLWAPKPMMNPEAVSGAISQIGFYFPVLSITDLFSVMNEENLKEYASIIIPMGITNVLGSLQNIESAEAAGDRFHTRNSLLVNGAGTVLGSFFGSPFPTTIYIGHPAWKAMGARTGYSILNGAVMTLIGTFGLMSLVSAIIPIEAGMAILLWIGIIIGAQAFESTPREHSPAIIFGLFPALAGWGVLMVQSMFNYANGKLGEILAKENITTSYAIQMQDVPPDLMFLPYSLSGLVALSQGFLLTSMIWGAICVHIIDRNFQKAAYWSFSASFLSAIGLIHAYKLAGNAILNNYEFPSSPQFTLAYILLGVFFYGFSFTNQKIEVQH